MKIRVLGCSGSIAAGSRTTSFLVDQDILLDAGTGVGDLTLDELARIEHICISHSHLDHVLSIGLLADSVMRLRGAQGKGPIQVHALPETLAALRQHIFNGVIWPDFTRLPSADAPLLARIGQRARHRVEDADLHGRALRAQHGGCRNHAGRGRDGPERRRLQELPAVQSIV